MQDPQEKLYNYTEIVEDSPPDADDEIKSSDTPIKECDKPTEHLKKKKRRRRFGDRKDGRKLRTIPAMIRFMPYIMADRNDASNTYADNFEILNAEKLCRQKIKEGKKNFSLLHILLAAYVRTVSQRPAINRFISGQKIFARNNIEVVMAIKKQMTIEGEETCIKVIFEPTDTIDDVYDKFNAAIEESMVEENNSSLEKVSNALLHLPGLLLRWAIKFLNMLDYFGIMPKSLTDLSPFHGSMIITSMGSLGVKPIYHHIYNFGNLPIFLAYGAKRSILVLDDDGNVVKKRIVDIKAVIDERICDGFYFASAFKYMKKLIEHPDVLLTPPDEVIDDAE